MQSYTEIPSSQSLQSSLALLLNNDKTSMSNSSGTAFPTTNLQVGMLCYRTDQNKLYILKDVTPTWSLIWDFNAPAVTKGAEIGGAVDLNTYTTTGWYHQSANADASGGTNYPSPEAGLLKVHAADGMVYQQYQTYATNTAELYFRSYYNGVWGQWRKVITLHNDGAGSGLDADMVDGYSPGNGSGKIPISNGTVNTNLNADLLDGRHAGNVNGNIPISNGTVNANLNADMLDGYHSTSFVRTVQGISPDGSGNVGGLVPLTGATMSGALISTSYLQSQRGTDPMLEVHKPGVIAGGLAITSDNRLSLVQSNGSGGWAATRFSLDLGSAGNAYVNGRTVWDSGNIGTPLNAVGGALTRSGNTVSLNTITTARFLSSPSSDGGYYISSIDAYGRVTGTGTWSPNCNCCG